MGASRDLTRTFVEWRAMREKSLGGARTFGGYERGSSQEHSPMSSSRAALPPVWVDVVEKVETDVATLERALKSLKEAHRARLMVSFDESREAELDREIERQSQNATQLFRACEKTLKRVATFGGDAADDSERKVRANVQRSVAVRIQALNTDRRAQKDSALKSWAEFLVRAQIWLYTTSTIGATRTCMSVRFPASRRRRAAPAGASTSSRRRRGTTRASPSTSSR